MSVRVADRGMSKMEYVHNAQQIVFLVTESGKVLKLLTSNSMASMKRKVKKGIDIANIYPSFESYIKSFNAYKKLYYFKQTYIIKSSEV